MIAEFYHYTSFTGFDGITSSRTLWVGNIHYLNDSREFKEGLECGEDELKRVLKKKISKELRVKIRESIGYLENVSRQSVYVCSFSVHGDQLSQWRGYCRGGGLSIGFTRAYIDEISALNGMYFVECLYDDKKYSAMAQHVNDLVSTDGLNSWQITSRIARIAGAFKSEGFKEEKEWRLMGTIPSDDPRVRLRATNKIILPYVELDLPIGVKDEIPFAEIIIGPSPHQQLLMSSLGMGFEIRKYGGQIRCSNIPFREM